MHLSICSVIKHILYGYFNFYFFALISEITMLHLSFNQILVTHYTYYMETLILFFLFLISDIIINHYHITQLLKFYCLLFLLNIVMF